VLEFKRSLQNALLQRCFFKKKKNKEILEVCPRPKRFLKCAQRKKLSPKKVGPKNLWINSFKCAQTKNGLKKSKRSHFNAASIKFSKKKSENSPPSWVCPKRKVKKSSKNVPKHEIYKKNRISSPIFASHPSFSILILDFSDFTKSKKWMKSGLGARSGRTLQKNLLCLELMFNKSCQDN
jgi:hypothetical protein